MEAMTANASQAFLEMVSIAQVRFNFTLIQTVLIFNLSLPTDIDECSNSNINNCSENANCTDTIGSYECTCSEGYGGSGIFCDGIYKLCAHINSNLISLTE